MAIDTFALFFMREDSPGAPVEWSKGDVVRAFLPSPAMIATPGTAQPRKCVLVVNSVQPPFSDLQWETLKTEIGKANEDPLPPDPEFEDNPSLVNRRDYNLDFDGVYDNELNPGDTTFMLALRAELLVSPYGATRQWQDVRGVFVRSKRNGNRPG